jgi:hypothetical protein
VSSSSSSRRAPLDDIDERLLNLLQLEVLT